MNNIAWKCKECGKVTYHPSAKKDGPELEIRTTTLCLKCMKGAKWN